jgi:membrane protein DedA with SNARE-associated domain
VAGFVLRNGYVLLFAVSLVEHLGVPLPASPLLIGAGALARSGHLALPAVVVVAMLASSLGHTVWFWAGRKRGASVLRLLCRLSLEPDSCVRRTEDLFTRYGARALVAGPWIPGLAMIAPPIAAMSGMTWRRFLALDALAALLWASIYASLGFLFGPQLELALQAALELGIWFALGIGVALGLWLAWKIAQRHWLLRSIALPRAGPEELLARLETGAPPTVVDLRHQIDLQAQPTSLPGALVVAFDELPDWADRLPRDREIILTCD